MTSPTDLAERLRALRIPQEPDEPHAVWYCKIGDTARSMLPNGSDAPMREAVQAAFARVTGKPEDYIFSGWAATLAEHELAVVENREPVYEKTDWALLTEAADVLDRLSALESGASGEVTDEEANRACQFWFAPEEPEEDRYKGRYARRFIERMKAALVAVLGPRLAKAEQRVKELEARLPEILHGDQDAAFECVCGDRLCAPARAASSSEPAPSCAENRGTTRAPHPPGLDVWASPRAEVGTSAGPSPSDGAYVDPWDALTDSERIAYLERAAYQGQGITYEAAFAIAQRMARDDAKKGQVA